MNTSIRARHAARGFSMVELLVAIVLAGIIFGAMVPLFANALKTTSRDNFRVTATNIAADRIEKVRMLNYADITDTNLNSSTFADNMFNASFTPAHGGKTFTIGLYAVDTQTKYKKITVTVSWSASDSTTMQTVVMNPVAITTGSTTGPTPGVTPSPGSTTGTDYALTVSVTNNTVTSAGVTVVRIDHARHDVQSPVKQIPNATNGLTVTWTPLVGGPDVIYRVTVTFQVSGHSVESKYTDVNLIDSTPVYFDTDPYH